MNVTAATGDLPDRRDDLDVGGLLQDVAACAGRERLADVARVVLHREDEDLRLGALVEQRRDRVEAVSVGHDDVHQDHVGLQGARLEDRLSSRARLADRLDVGLLLEQEPDSRADDRVVVDDQHPGR